MPDPNSAHPLFESFRRLVEDVTRAPANHAQATRRELIIALCDRIDILATEISDPTIRKECGSRVVLTRECLKENGRVCCKSFGSRKEVSDA